MNIKKLLVQFGKFAVVGLLNTAIDFGVLNLLIFVTGVREGITIFFLNGISFAIATANSYLWNKYWTFRDRESVRVFQIGQFLVISAIGAVLNSGIVYLISTFVSPLFNLSPAVWVNMAKILATGVSFIWNFAGYKFVVFKK
ncbi:MAG: GtrA family protein [Parcubacteria group bacterium]|jgi:putative flippase GtrA